MENLVVQRIRMALNCYCVTVSFLAEQLKMKQSTLIGKLNGTRSLDIDTLCKILTAFPFLSVEWVLLGKGEMEKKNQPDPDDSFKCSDMELKEMYLDQSKEIHRLKKRIAQLEQEKTQK